MNVPVSWEGAAGDDLSRQPLRDIDQMSILRSEYEAEDCRLISANTVLGLVVCGLGRAGSGYGVDDRGLAIQRSHIVRCRAAHSK